VATGLFAEEIVRFMGKGLEVSLAAEWGGLPTVRALRHSDSGNDVLRKQRRREIAELTNSALPTRKEEQANPVAADERYDDAVRRCFTIARGRQPKSLLSEENAHYGFRRNMLALRVTALVVIVIVLGADIWLGHLEGSFSKLVVCGILLVLDAALWCTFVRRAWVKVQAETLSQRFFLTIGTLN
jgi:hypothetical protein